MPNARINGVRLHYEVSGSGVPLVLVHEFAGDSRSWDPQVKFFARRYQVVTYNARGYPPSEVPTDPDAYSQEIAVEDLHGLVRHLALPGAHFCGLSMGGYAVLHFGLRYPTLARSLVVAGCGYGSDDQPQFRRDAEDLARRMEQQGMATLGADYARGPTRVPFMNKDPRGWNEFAEALAAHSDVGSARTMQGVQARRPSVYDLQGALGGLRVPTLIVNGDEDDPCLAPGLFIKRHVPAAGLLVLPRTGHTMNLEEPDLFNRAVLDFITTVDAGRWLPRDPATQALIARSALLPERGSS
jgi:pimeloyl-ACP methyl ester carboxylesterase